VSSALSSSPVALQSASKSVASLDAVLLPNGRAVLSLVPHLGKVSAPAQTQEAALVDAVAHLVEAFALVSAEQTLRIQAFLLQCPVAAMTPVIQGLYHADLTVVARCAMVLIRLGKGVAPVVAAALQDAPLHAYQRSLLMPLLVELGLVAVS